MNAREKSKAWAVDQLDPDNWLKIPEFGVPPQSVFFDGFAYPIVCPTTSDDSYRLRRIVREHVTTARMLIRKEFETLLKVTESYSEVLDMMERRPDTEEITPSHAQVMAVYYFLAMGSAESAVRYADGGHGRVVTKKTHGVSLDSIADCAEAVRLMALKNTSYGSVLILREKIEAIESGRRSQTSAAGRASGDARRAKAACTKEMVMKGYQTYMASGTEEKDVAAKLAARYGVTSDYIRLLRRKAQIKRD